MCAFGGVWSHVSTSGNGHHLTRLLTGWHAPRMHERTTTCSRNLHSPTFYTNFQSLRCVHKRLTNELDAMHRPPLVHIMYVCMTASSVLARPVVTPHLAPAHVTQGVTATSACRASRFRMIHTHSKDVYQRPADNASPLCLRMWLPKA